MKGMPTVAPPSLVKPLLYLEGCKPSAWGCPDRGGPPKRPYMRGRAYLRPLSGPPRLGWGKIDGWQPSNYKKGFTRDGGTEVGAPFISSLFLAAYVQSTLVE